MMVRGKGLRLDYITLFVDDLAGVRDWYIAMLDLSVVHEGTNFVMLVGEGGARLGLYQGDPLTTPEKVQIHFQVTDVDNVYGELVEKGVSFSRGPQTEPWGHRSAYTQDPAGHTIELFTIEA